MRGPLLTLAVALALLLGSLTTAAWAAPPAAAVTHGPRDAPRVALTFDDNFAPDRAIPALEVLRTLDCPATIFVTGMYVNSYYDIVRQIAQGVAAGLLEVGDHSSTHPFLTKLPWSSLMDEIGAGTAAFTAVTGVRTVPLLRPPYGATDVTVSEAAGAKGMRYIVLWDVGSDDWKGLSAETIRADILKNTRPGSIILLHLAAAHTYEAIPGIVAGLRARGFELVTVSELLKDGRRFLDVNETTPGGNAILRIVDAGYMSGYDESYFGPFDPITRAQFAKVSMLATRLHTPAIEAESRPTFVDVPVVRDVSGNAVAYPFDYVEEAVAAGLVTGRPTSAGMEFRPRDHISRVQLAQIVARMARRIRGYPEPAAPLGPVPDDVPGYAAADVRLVIDLGLMTGYNNDRFDSWAPARRVQVAEVVSRFLDLPPYEPPVTTTTTTAPTTSTTTTTLVPPTTTTTAPSTTTTTQHIPRPTTSTTVPSTMAPPPGTE